MTQKPALLLFPNLLADTKHHEIYLPPSVDKAVATLDGLIAESERAGRRFLSRFETKLPARDIPIALYNEHTSDDEIDFLLEPIKGGERWGLVSDCGLPCIADPGSKVVARARKTGVKIQGFVGPSSIFLALMLSGLPGQQFAFHGYLSKNEDLLASQILEIEKDAQKKKATQIFMERPYRSRQMLEALLNELDDATRLSVAWELTTPDQGVVTETVAVWKRSALPNLDKKCAIFLVSI